MPAAARLRKLAEYHLDVLQLGSGEPPARDLGAVAAIAPCGIRKIDQIVVGKPRMDRDIHQAALAVGGDAGQAGYGLRIELPVPADDPQPARTLRDEHAAIGQERKPPRMLEPLDQPDDTKRVLVGGDRLRASGRGAQSESGTQQRRGARTAEEFYERMNCIHKGTGRIANSRDCRSPNT